MLTAENICLYDNARTILPPTTVSVAVGELVKVVGGNGTGKTSLLKILAGVSPSDDGAVRWHDKDIHTVADNYREEVLYIGHQNGLSAELSPLENLRAAALLHLRVPFASLTEALADAGLANLHHRRCRLLSAGQCRRAALARLRAFRARLWLLDEPLAALDDAGRRMLTAWLSAHLADGGMAIAVMHEADDWQIAATRVVECGNAS